MSLVSKTLSGLYNGVSQQPPVYRLDSQCSIQENALGDLVKGLKKRPNTRIKARIDNVTMDDNTFIHEVNRDANEQYLMFFTGSSDNPVSIFTLDGDECNVIFDEDEDEVREYFQVENPKKSLKAVTIADYTVLVNTQKIPLMKYTKSEWTTKSISGTQTRTSENPQANEKAALVWVERGFYDVDYTVEIHYNRFSKVKATVSIPLPEEALQGNSMAKTTDIANELIQALVENFGDAFEEEGWTFGESDGSVISIRNYNDIPFTVKVSDSYGNHAMKAYKNSVQKFDDLPPTAPEGYVMTVTGTDSSSFDNFYVKFKQDERGTGIWEETTRDYDDEGNMIKHSINSSTMPHKIVRTGFREFTVSPIIWDRRHVGDENSAPDPSFIGSTINNVFFFKNRLGFISSDKVIMSRAGDFFNFFPSTATDVLDGDPIDISVSSRQVANLQHVVPYMNSVLLSSEQQQFMLHGSAGILTPVSVSVDPATSYEIDPNCTPVSSGSHIYYSLKQDSFSSIREYEIQTSGFPSTSEDITSHVPRYLPKNVEKLVTSANQNVLLAFSKEEPNVIYVYQYYWDGEVKVQSAWSKWLFDFKILDISFIENKILLLTKNKKEDIFLQEINLTQEEKAFNIYLDNMLEIQGVYDEDSNTTIWFHELTSFSPLTTRIVNKDTGLSIRNIRVQTNNTLQAKGDLSQQPFIVGDVYTMRYRFNPWFIRDNNGIADTQGRLQVRNLTLAYTDSGVFKVCVNGRCRVFTGAVLGQVHLGKASVQTGEKRFVIGGNARNVDIDIINDDYLPSTFQSASFEGFWTSRSRRV